MYSDVFSAFKPSLRSSGQSQRSTWGPTPDSKSVPRSRVLTGETLNEHLMVGETGIPRENPLRHGQDMPQSGIQSRTFFL